MVNIRTREIRFKTIASARKGQSKFKKDFGFRPSLFTLINEKKKTKRFFIVKPKGLKKIR